MKVNYLGYELREIVMNEERKDWRACYVGPENYALGSAHSPEAAVAMAQKIIKERINAT